MKKIILAISALSAALFSTAANADISVSGSANTIYTDAGEILKHHRWWHFLSNYFGLRYDYVNKATISNDKVRWC